MEEIPGHRFAKVISILFVWRHDDTLVASSCAVCCVDFSIRAKVFANNKYLDGNLVQVKLSGAGKWPYSTSAYRNPLFQNTPNFVRRM